MVVKISKKRSIIIPFSRDILILPSIFVFSLLIRMIGLRHGFPLLTRPDEELIMDQVFFMTRDGFWYPGNPGTFARPNQILYTLNYFYLNMMSYLRFGENYAARYLLYQLHFYHYGRLLIAVIGSLIPLVAYQIGKLFKPNLGLAAGMVFMLFPSYVLHSLFITPDVPITLFTLLVIYFTLHYLIKSRTSSIYIAGIFAAINTAEKYPGIISLGIVLLGVLIKTLELPDQALNVKIIKVGQRTIIVIAVFVVALFLVAPKLFINHSLALGGVLLSADSSHPGVDQLGFWGRLAFYFQAFGSWSNIIALLLISVGCFALIKWRNKATLILLYGALYWLLLSIVALHWERWALPMYITPLFLIAVGVSFIWEKAHKQPITRWIAILLIGYYFTQQLIFAVHTPIRRSFTDTRLVSSAYCASQGITANNSLFEGYTPLQERQDFAIIFEDYQLMQDEIGYILLSSDIYDRYYQEPERYSHEVAIYDTIRRDHHLLAKFEPSQPPENSIQRMGDILFYIRRTLGQTITDRFRGPVIEIYQVKP